MSTASKGFTSDQLLISLNSVDSDAKEILAISSKEKTKNSIDIRLLLAILFIKFLLI